MKWMFGICLVVTGFVANKAVYASAENSTEKTLGSLYWYCAVNASEKQESNEEVYVLLLPSHSCKTLQRPALVGDSQLVLQSTEESSLQQAAAITAAFAGAPRALLALRTTPKTFLVVGAVALLGGWVWKSQWGEGVFPSLGSSLEEMLRGLKNTAPKGLEDAVGTVEGNMRDILEAADKTVKAGLGVAKQSLDPLEKGVNDYVGKMLEDIGARIKKEVAWQVKQGRINLDGGIELSKALWNKALGDLESLLERLLDEISEVFSDEGRSLRSIVDPKQKRREFFRKLGLSEGASFEEVKKRYREIAKKTHPDIHGHNESKLKEFYEAHKAYEALKKLMDNGHPPSK